MKSYRYTSRYLETWFRKTVLGMWGNKCVFTFNSNIAELEVHHIIPRNRRILKYDWRNGIPLSVSTNPRYLIKGMTAHQYAGTLQGENKIRLLIGGIIWDYLCHQELINYKDFLVQRGLTDNEFRKNELEILKKKFKELKDG